MQGCLTQRNYKIMIKIRCSERVNRCTKSWSVDRIIKCEDKVFRRLLVLRETITLGHRYTPQRIKERISRLDRYLVDIDSFECCYTSERSHKKDQV